MLPGLEAPYVRTTLVRVSTRSLQSVVNKHGGQKNDVPYSIPFSLVAGSFKRGYLLHTW